MCCPSLFLKDFSHRRSFNREIDVYCLKNFNVIKQVFSVMKSEGCTWMKTSKASSARSPATSKVTVKML